MNKPLEDYLFLNTRPRNQSKELTGLLKRRGGNVLELPILEINASEYNRSNYENIIETLTDEDWLVFTSRNGVNCFTKEILLLLRSKTPHIAAIGGRTLESLDSLGLGAEFVPDEAHSKSFVECFSKKYPEAGKVFLLRGDTAGRVLPEGLKEKGYEVEEVVVYNSRKTEVDPSTLNYFLEAAKVKKPLVILSSALTAEYFKESLEAESLLGEFEAIPTAVIGPETKQAVEQLGFKVLLQAEKATMESIVTGLVDFIARPN